MKSLTVSYAVEPEHPFDIVRKNLSIHRYQMYEIFICLISTCIIYTTLRKRVKQAPVISIMVGLCLFMFIIYTIRRTNKVFTSNIGEYDQLSAYSDKLGNKDDKSKIPVLLTILTPLFDLLAVYFKGGSPRCTDTKPLAITSFLRFWNSYRIYCPVDYTIPSQQIISTVHIGYHPDLKNMDIGLIKDSLCFFPFFSSEQTHITTSVFPDKYEISSRIWNNIHISEKKHSEERKTDVNNLYKYVREEAKTNRKMSVVMFISGAERQDCSIYHWQPIYDGCACMAMITGIPIVLLFNAYFRSTDNKEHFRQIVSKPIFINKVLSDEEFDFQKFKNKYNAQLQIVKNKLETEMTTITRKLRKLHHLYDSNLNIYPWAVDSQNKSCPICHDIQ